MAADLLIFRITGFETSTSSTRVMLFVLYVVICRFFAT